MTDLAVLSSKDFSPRLDEPFLVAQPQGDPIPLRLVEVTEKPAAAGGTREPFSLLFRGPLEPILAQAIRQMHNTALGEIHLFLVPIGQDADGTLYEAVFT